MVKFLSLVTLALFSSLAIASDDAVFRPRHPNAARVAARRQAEAHHAALVAEREFTPSASPRKRSSGRCKARTTTTSSVFYTTTTSKKTETTSKVQAPVNPGGDPTTTTSSHHATTTKEAVEQTTSTKPTTTRKAEVKTTSTTKKAAAEPTTTSGGGGGGSGTVHHGDGTYYGVGLGACGIDNTDSDMICAVSQLLYDNYPGATANPNNNPVCGKYITASYGGKSVRVKVVDRCVGCKVDDLDFSPAAFSQLADQSLGRISITWQWD